MLGQRLQELRGGCGWSQVEVAKRLRVTKQTVSNWENENIQPSIDMLVRLAQLYNVSTDYLLGMESVPRLNVDGVPSGVVAHLSLLIDDCRNK